jgi:hypothetical protein
MCLRLEMTSWLNELGDVVWVTNDLIEVWRLCMRYALRLFVLLKQDAAHLIVIYLNSECDIRVRHPNISTTEPSPKKYYYKTSTPLLGAFHIISICGPLGLVKYVGGGGEDSEARRPSAKRISGEFGAKTFFTGWRPTPRVCKHLKYLNHFLHSPWKISHVSHDDPVIQGCDESLFRTSILSGYHHLGMLTR